MKERWLLIQAYDYNLSPMLMYYNDKRKMFVGSIKEATFFEFEWDARDAINGINTPGVFMIDRVYSKSVKV